MVPYIFCKSPADRKHHTANIRLVRSIKLSNIPVLLFMNGQLPDFGPTFARGNEKPATNTKIYKKSV
jgi:hypothetical protein